MDHEERAALQALLDECGQREAADDVGMAIYQAIDNALTAQRRARQASDWHSYVFRMVYPMATLMEHNHQPAAAPARH